MNKDVPILISRKAAARLLGVSTSMVAVLIAKKKLEPVRIGRRVLLRRADVEIFAMTPAQKKSMEEECSVRVQ